MSSPESSQSRRPPLEVALRKTTEVVQDLTQTGKPALVGQVSLRLGWWAPLSVTEGYLDELVATGVLRPITPHERTLFGLEGKAYFVIPQDIY